MQEALDDFESVDQTELLDIMDTRDCRNIPNASNYEHILTQMAHRDIIQAPMFVIDCWKPIVSGYGPTRTELLQLQTKTTAKNILKVLNFPSDMGDEEKVVSVHLKKYIRELDTKGCKQFCRFCTGSDIMLTNAIHVQFMDMTDFERRPMAHTCTDSLTLARKYQNYPDFRSDFNAVLYQSVWVMDMV